MKIMTFIYRKKEISDMVNSGRHKRSLSENQFLGSNHFRCDLLVGYGIEILRLLE